MYQTSAERCSNSFFQLLLKPEIRPHTTLRKQQDCHPPAHPWGRGIGGCPDTAAAPMPEEHREEAGKRRLAQAPGTAWAPSTARGRWSYTQAPHTTPGSWLARIANQVAHSRRSEVSCKWLLTDLKNYPVHLHPSRRHRGRRAEPICSPDNPTDLLKSTYIINHCYQLWSKTGRLGISGHTARSNLFTSWARSSWAPAQPVLAKC